VRALILLPMILLVGCSSVLGIDDPKPVIDSGVSPPDVTTTSTDQLTVSLTDVKLAQGQMVRLHVLLVHKDLTMQDVTASAMLTSSNDAVAKGGGPGQINGGSQVGSATITASLGTAMPATVAATVTAAKCHPVINELITGTAASPAEEWVEIYNTCSTPVPVVGWTLIYRAAPATGADTSVLVTLTGSMDPGTFRLYSGTGYLGVTDDDAHKWASTLQQNEGAIGLRSGIKDTGPLVDSVAYGDLTMNLDPLNPFIEVSPAPYMTNGKSASRLPFDGNDTNDNGADVKAIATATPHASNVP
jgi:hypothetical protein